jgi:transposase
MIPRTITCDECHETATVRGYGRVEYDWEEEEHGATALRIKAVRLTIDCPNCGVVVQEHRPDRQLAS